VQAQARGRANPSELDAKASELQGELAMINARLNLLNQMAVFVDAGNSRRAAADALKARIDAIAVSVPGLMPTEPSAAPGTGTARPATAALPSASSSTPVSSQGGLWQMITTTLALERKNTSITDIDQRTAALQQMLSQLRSAPMRRLDEMSKQSETLAHRADQAHGSELRAVRAQLDTLAWLFQQTSAMLVPLVKEGVLLDQYRRNLSSWHDIAERQYHEALSALLVRLGILAGVLALIFAGGELWRRVVLRYTVELRRRQQLLLIRKLTLSALVLLIIGLMFFSQLGSFATFAGLITAGVAVAMQSVLTCIVGYFLLIGKYGLRVGDRVQINNVTGEIIDLGLIRLHLMELGADGKLGATGRVVALPNSIVFQATGGLFRQLPGASLVWHEVVVSLPSDRDYARFKSQLMPLLVDALHEVQEAIRRQSRVIQQTASTAVSISEPQVQLRLTGGSSEVVVRYPVQLERAAEIDEKISQAIRGLLAQKGA
jgi:small-conductance mechanosensitive channel